MSVIFLLTFSFDLYIEEINNYVKSLLNGHSFRKNSFEIQILSQCQDFCRSVQIKKNCTKKTQSSYYIC